MKNDQLPNITKIGNGSKLRATCAQAIGYVNTFTSAATAAQLESFFNACAAACVGREPASPPDGDGDGDGGEEGGGTSPIEPPDPPDAYSPEVFPIQFTLEWGTPPEYGVPTNIIVRDPAGVPVDESRYFSYRWQRGAGMYWTDLFSTGGQPRQITPTTELVSPGTNLRMTMTVNHPNGSMYTFNSPASTVKEQVTGAGYVLTMTTPGYNEPHTVTLSLDGNPADMGSVGLAWYTSDTGEYFSALGVGHDAIWTPTEAEVPVGKHLRAGASIQINGQWQMVYSNSYVPSSVT